MRAAFGLNDRVRVSRDFDDFDDFEDIVSSIVSWVGEDRYEYFFEQHADPAAEDQMQLIAQATTPTRFPEPKYRVGQIVRAAGPDLDTSPCYGQIVQISCSIGIRMSDNQIRYYLDTGDQAIETEITHRLVSITI